MRPEKRSLPKAQMKKRRRSSWLPSCFLGSSVSDSDAPEPPPPPRSSAPSKREREKKAVATVDAPSKAAVAEESNNSSAKQQNNVDSNSRRWSLPHISQKYTARRRPTSPSKNSRPVRAQIERTVTSGSTVSSSSPADSTRTGELGPVFGVGIMLATLVILLFADRVTAVACLCSCLYTLRLARASSVSPGDCCDDVKLGAKVVDMDSNEHKKRVILEGLLERNGRRPSLLIAATA